MAEEVDVHGASAAGTGARGAGARQHVEEEAVGVARSAAVEQERWTRLADERAAELLGSAVVEPALIMAPPGSFPVRLPRCAGGRGTFAAVLDASRPEAPAAPDALIAEMVELCRPGGTIALFACGGGGAEDRRGAFAPRDLGRLRSALAAAGCTIEREVPFDLLAPLSPWRLGLGARGPEVLAELEEHLACRGVRRAVRLVETELVAGWDPAWAGRVFVVARKDGERGSVPGPAPRDPRWDLLAPDFARAALPLLHDDDVVRWLVFVDAEWLAAFSIPFDLLGYVEGLATDPLRRRAVRRLLRKRRRWWQPGLEAARFREAACRRLVRGTVAALAVAPGAFAGEVNLPATLEYDLACAFNAVIDELGRGEAG